MSVTTIGAIGGYADLGPAKEKGESFFKRLADRFIEARMQDARHRVSYHLQTLDGATLKALKLSEVEIARIQAGNF